MKGANNTYFGNIQEGIISTWKALVLTFQHLWQSRKRRKPINVENKNYFDQQQGIVTLEYPYEAIPVPDNGRYRLHNEMDDCIVCDLCAKICPVNCIEIEPVKAVAEIGKTSDGSAKRIYAAKFDIDMAKCCYCGLCTTVCPTECLTMTKTYDYSEFDIRNMVYHFTDLNPQQAEAKKKEYDDSQAQKAAAAALAKATSPNPTTTPDVSTSGEEAIPAAKPKPVFKPKIPMPPKKDENKPEDFADSNNTVTPSAPEASTSGEGDTPAPAPKPKPVFKPKIPMPPKKDKDQDKPDDAN